MMDSLFFSIILMISIQRLSSEYITQRPTHLDIHEGDSGKIFCSVPNNIDIRALSLEKSREKILHLCLLNDTKPNFLSFSGTIENLKCEFSETAGDEATCAMEDKKDLSKGDYCSPPPENSIKKFLYHGPQILATIWVNSAYKSCIDLSGTIRNLSLTLQHLTPHDDGSYACSGYASDMGEFRADSTQLTVTQGSTHTAIIVVSVVASIVIIGAVVIYVVRQRKIC